MSLGTENMYSARPKASDKSGASETPFRLSGLTWYRVLLHQPQQADYSSHDLTDLYRQVVYDDPFQHRVSISISPAGFGSKPQKAAAEHLYGQSEATWTTSERAASTGVAFFSPAEAGLVGCLSNSVIAQVNASPTETKKRGGKNAYRPGGRWLPLSLSQSR